jgi:hypothetical protein
MALPRDGGELAVPDVLALGVICGGNDVAVLLETAAEA